METIIEKKYQITREQCQSLIRPNTCCRGCGGELSPIETVDNSDNPTFWLHCPECMVFENGISNEVYAVAKEMVETHGYIEYRGEQDAKESDYQYWLQIQKRGACGTIRTILAVYNRQKSAKPTPEFIEQVHQMD